MEQVKDLCKMESCDPINCKLRHPRKCKYFETFGNCKFGNYCAYSNLPSEDKGKIKDLEKMIQTAK